MELPRGKSPSLDGESSSSSRKDYEVFLSFRGPDTRLTITDSLYATMIRAGIRVFKDDEELRVGKKIGGELQRAISNSKIYVPIFSKDYASSKWCLCELTCMVKHWKSGEKVILPIFFDVDASDVKLKTGSYSMALRKHERESGEDVAKQWEEALREVAGIKGWNLKDHGQDKLIALVLEEVFRKLRRPTQRNWHDYLVGVHDQMEAVMELLSLGTSGVRFAVIRGMGGIGKTTIAKAIFKCITSQFQYSSLLSQVNDNLKVIYLTSCNYLKRTPDFSKCMNLKKLVFKHWGRLEEINSSINKLGRLKYLEISKEGHVSLKYIHFARMAYLRVPPSLDSIGGLRSLSVLKVERRNSVIELPQSIGELLLGLKHLSLRGCNKLEKLPSSIGELRSLLSLDLSCTWISGLPDSIGELRSLLSLDLSCTWISGLPDSIGRLESLLELDISQTPIANLPDSIGNLRRLEFMCLDGTKIRELPKSVWALENLDELNAKGCQNLEGEIPSEIERLSQLMVLHLSQSKVSRLPMTINRLSNLRELLLSDCNGLQLLPDLPTSLTELELSSSSLQAVPNLSNLANLRHLDISDRAFDFTVFEATQGRVQNPNLEWLGRLQKLQMLRLVLSDCNLPPTDLSSLSQLRSLEITCPDPQSLTRLPSSLEDLILEDVETPIEWPLFSNLGNLSELKLLGCRLTELEFDNVLGQLENLHRLQVRKCESLVRLSNLSSLKELRVLSVEYCPQLTEIESQPSSTRDCSSTERPIPDSLKLEKLESFRVYCCKSVRKLPAIPNACRVEVSPPKYVRRSESGPVFIEDLDIYREAPNMEILSERNRRRERYFSARLSNPQRELFEQFVGPSDLSPLRTSPEKENLVPKKKI